MAKIGAKEAQTRRLREAVAALSGQTEMPAIPTAFKRGHPDCAVSAIPTPAPTKTTADPGVSLAPSIPAPPAKATSKSFSETPAGQYTPQAAVQAIKESNTMTTTAKKKPAAPKSKKGTKTAAKKPAKKAARSPARGSGARHRYDWKTAEIMAKAGSIPPAPDFSAETHARYRPVLDEVVKAAKAGDVKALKAIKINPISSSPKAVDRYRGLCVMAINAKS